MNFAHAIATAAEQQLSVQDHILQSGFPCPIAQAVTRNDALAVYNYSTMQADAQRVYHDVGTWLGTTDQFRFRSFVAVFQDEATQNLSQDHTSLWQCLSDMRACEPTQRTVPAGTSDDINDPNFAFSIHGHAFYVVGLSPHSPRKSRRTPFSGFALNLHQQFEDLRQSGTLETVKEASRARDMRFQGSTNPLLADHGQSSAALQYSSMPVSGPHECPFAVPGKGKQQA